MRTGETGNEVSVFGHCSASHEDTLHVVLYTHSCSVQIISLQHKGEGMRSGIA